MPSRGIIYLVAGPRSYVGELTTSLTSLRRHEPTLPVTVFSPYDLPRRSKCTHVRFESNEHPLKQKVLALEQTPYEHTLFLDTDTTILAPIADIFDYLDAHNFAAARGSLMDRSVQPARMVELVSPDEYNTGVLLYDTSRATRAFLQRWKDAVMPQDPNDMWAGHNCDQTYFNRLTQSGTPEACGVLFATVPNIVYNVRGYMVDEMKQRDLWKDARIFHYRTRTMKLRKAAASLTSFDALRELTRKTMNRRVQKKARI